MPTVYDVPADAFIKHLTEHLKENYEIEPPSWATFAKTSSHAERAPLDADWWHVRAASLLRKTYIEGPIGISRLRKLYGGRTGPGTKPEHFRKGSGNILRKLLQQLEKAGLIKTVDKKGRVLTKEGKALLDTLAGKVKQETVKNIPELKKYG